MPNIDIIHSDRKDVFNNQGSFAFLEQLGVKPSTGSAKGYQNQVVEEINRTVNQILCYIIQPNWIRKQPKPFNQPIHSFKQMDLFVIQGIEFCN